MVGASEKEKGVSSSRPLQNIFPMPFSLKWAHQKQLHCVKEKDGNINNEKKSGEEELRRNLRPRGPSGRALGNLDLCALEERALRNNLLASDKGEGYGSGDHQLPRISLALSKEEIEIDFLLMTGAKPPRKPGRRPKKLVQKSNRRPTKPVQKQLDALFPGSLLTEVNSWIYDVPGRREPQGEK